MIFFFWKHQFAEGVLQIPVICQPRYLKEAMTRAAFQPTPMLIFDWLPSFWNPRGRASVRSQDSVPTSAELNRFQKPRGVSIVTNLT